MNSVTVMGLGYIGLPTAVLLARRGHDVLGVDVLEYVVEGVNSGRLHLAEPGLEEPLNDALASGKLRASCEVSSAEVFIIAVPTPVTPSLGPDLSYVYAAVDAIADCLSAGVLVVLESTSPVGTSRVLSERLAALRPELIFPHQSDSPDVYIAYCPERVIPGRTLIELVENDRVIGGLSEACTQRAIQFYKGFVNGLCRGCAAELAEMAKLAENAYRDVNIAFANELSSLADHFEVDVWELIDAANLHPRVDILNPGPGVGGHCIAVDPWFLYHASSDRAQLILKARQVNDLQPKRVADKMLSALEESGSETAVCLGLSYKANVDDYRHSPAVEVCRLLAESGPYKILVVEPHATKLPPDLASYQNVELVEFREAIQQADVIGLLVDHEAFLDLPDRHDLDSKLIIDTRGCWRSRGS